MSENEARDDTRDHTSTPGADPRPDVTAGSAAQVDRYVRLVAVCGAAGGLLAWAILLWRGSPAQVHVALDAVLSMLLGAGASVVFVFLISNTDRRDRARLIALSLVAGFSWEPVWEASKALVDQEIEQTRQRTAVEATQRAADLAEDLDEAPPEKREKIEEEIRRELTKAETAARKIDSVAALEQIRVASRDLLVAPVPRQELSELMVTIDPARRALPRSGDFRIASPALFEANLVPAALPESGVPPIRQMTELVPGRAVSRPATGEGEAWFRLQSGAASTATIRIDAESVAAALYDRRSGRGLVSQAHESGALGVQLRTRLEPGSYVLLVRSLDDAPLRDFDVEVSENG